MKHRLPFVHAAWFVLLFGLSCLSSVAQAAAAPLPGGPKLFSCSKARDPARCEARLKARRACGDKRGTSKRQCMAAYLISPDCARADQPKQCAARKQAERSCHGKKGKAFKTCVKTALAKRPAKANKPSASGALPKQS